MLGAAPIVEVTAKNAVLDEIGFLAGVAFVIEVDGTAKVRIGPVVHDRDELLGNLLPDLIGEDRNTLPVEVGLHAVADGLMQQNSRGSRRKHYGEFAGRRSAGLEEYGGPIDGVLNKVVVADPIRDFAVRLVLSTHPGTDFASEQVRRFVRWGASPRAAQSLIKAARVRALAEGRAHVAFEDIRYFSKDVLRHRVLLNYDGQAENIQVPDLIDDCVAQLPEEV